MPDGDAGIQLGRRDDPCLRLSLLLKAAHPVAVGEVPALAQNGTRNFVLGHLSQNNNLGLLAQQASEQALLQAGLERGDFTLQIANRSQLSQPVLL